MQSVLSRSGDELSAFGTGRALRSASGRKALDEDLKVMLRITIRETADELAINLEGRVAGPWVAELEQVWTEAKQRLNDRDVSLDLRDVTYMDEDGKQILRRIEMETGADLIATTPWTRHLVAQIRDTKANA
jgi:hypothetical protein